MYRSIFASRYLVHWAGRGHEEPGWVLYEGAVRLWNLLAISAYGLACVGKGVLYLIGRRVVSQLCIDLPM